LCILYDR